MLYRKEIENKNEYNYSSYQLLKAKRQWNTLIVKIKYN